MTEKPADLDSTVAGTEPDTVPSAGTDPVATPVVSATANDARQSPPVGARKPGRGLWLALMLCALLAAMLATGLWYQRQAFDQLGRDLAARIDGVMAFAESARSDAEQARSLARSQAAAIQGLQTALADIRSQYQALQDAWEPPGEAANAGLLNDIEQLLSQAHQQLRLGGNVGNAIIALEIVQTRLASVARSEFASLQQAVQADLSRLRAVPVVDVAALVARIDQLIALSARAPLLAPDTAVPALSEVDTPATASPSPPRTAQPENASWWQRLHDEVASWPRRALAGFGREMNGLISIRRVDDGNALLWAPDQAEQLRATLRMRLLTAQIALLMRQAAVWQGELSIVSAALAANYDARSVDTVTAVQLARELSEVNVAETLPGLDESLKVIATLRTVGGALATQED